MSPHARPPKRAVRPAESGMALVLAMFALTTIVVASTSALLIASADIRATRNYRQASQVHFAAESAIAHALQVVNGPGVVNFQNDVVGNWGTLFGTGTRSFGPVAGYAYTVSAAADPADVVNAGRFVATVTGGLPPFGTTEHPQITYFNDPSGVTVKGAGNVEGVGILIVEGDLTIQGSLSFSGLIIVRGRTRVIGTTTETGNATLYGALWTNDLNLTIGGSAVMNYSSAALAFANQASGGMTLPTPVQLTSLIDCSQAVAGTSGCP